MDIPIEIQKEILQILDNSDLEKESSHAENTLYWVKRLKPKASLALQIAALAHDIERGDSPRYRSEDFEDHNEYKRLHSNRGAEILENLLHKYNVDKSVIQEATDLVRMHEVGGSEDADILMDADSISFFDNNLDFYYHYKGLEGTIEQIDYKFERCSPRAKKYIENLDSYKSFKNLGKDNIN